MGHTQILYGTPNKQTTSEETADQEIFVIHKKHRKLRKEATWGTTGDFKVENELYYRKKLKEDNAACWKKTVYDLTVNDANHLEYHKVPECDTWRINFLKELIEIKHDEIEVPGMMKEELDQIIN